MKSCEEMTRSVTERVQKEKAARRRNRTVIATCVCCIGLVAALGLTSHVLLPNDQKPTVPVTSFTPGNDAAGRVEHKPDSPRVMLLHSLADGRTVSEIKENVAFPYGNLIRIRKVSGLSKTELQTVLEEEKLSLTEYFSEYPAESLNSWSSYLGSDALILTASAGAFVIHVEDMENVENMRVSVTEDGYASIVPHILDMVCVADGRLQIYLAQDGLTSAYSQEQNGIVVHWTLSPMAAKKIKDDPDMQLSDLHDTITVTVQYKDGRKEISVIDMFFEDNGQVKASCRGTTVQS